MKNILISTFFVLLCLFTEGRANQAYFNHLDVKDGLSQINIISIYQDETGALWFGSLEGINRYNGHSFTVFHPSQNNEGLAQNEIMAICGDKKGNMYIQASHDLVHFDIKKQTFHRLASNKVFNVDYQKDTLWVVTAKKLLYRTENDSVFHSFAAFKEDISAYAPLCFTDQYIYVGTYNGIIRISRSTPLAAHEKILPNTIIKCIYQDSKKNIWIGTSDKGLYQLCQKQGLKNFIHHPDNPNSLSNNRVRCVIEDDLGNLWIGTFYGLNRYNPIQNTWSHFIHKSQDSQSLSHSSVFALYKDTQGGIWIGTYYGGVNYFNPTSDHANFYSANPDDPSALSFPFVGRMEEDEKHNLWVCTEGGGLHYFDRQTKQFTCYSNLKPKTSPTGKNNMKCIWYQKETGKLYIGTYTEGLIIFNTKTNDSRNIKKELNKKNSLPNNFVLNLQPYKDRLILSTQSGLVAMNLKTEVIEPVSDIPAIQSIVTNHTYETFYIDKNDNLWLASGTGGVSKVNLITGKIKYYYHKDNTDNTIGRFKVLHIFENHKAELFFSTSGSGLFKYSPQEETFKCYSKDNNLLYSNYCYYATENQLHELIVLHNHGISVLDTENHKLLYTHRTPQTSYCQGSSIYCTSDGELYLGGINGMVALSPNTLSVHNKDHNLYFDRLIINNKSITPGDESNILSQTLPYTQKITLKHNQNNLAILLGNSNYLQNKYNYEYKLEGFGDIWLPLYSPKIIYTNLAPGNYKLTVRELTNTQMVCDEISLSFHITPPFYANIYAYFIYSALLAFILFSIIRFNNRQAKLKASVLFERKEKEKVEELNQHKMRFFTNISHEFRTPLTLIMGQSESLLQLNLFSPSIYNRILRIYKNASHMNTLISELLDIHKQEQGYLKLRIEHHDIVTFTKEIYMFFYEYALKKHITYKFESSEPSGELWFDSKQMQKVILNLLSNAFKYTPEGGNISVCVQVGITQVYIKIKDSGTGIPKESIQKIFDRFYQIDGQKSQFSLGTGIGLALAKAIVELHKGEIQVESEVDKGSCFIVALQTGNAHFTPEDLQNDSSVSSTADLDVLPMQEEIELPDDQAQSANKPTILLVEDNEEVLNMLVDIFSPTYEVYTASNGLKGWEETQRLQPDLVLSDIMMPEMSGKKMCYKIKNNVNLSHIPVVLLTALSSVEYAIEGYMYGADDYITKPFNIQLLLSRCNNLINNRRLLMKKFRKQQSENPVIGNAVSHADKELLDKAIEIIKNNFENQDFNMNVLAAELAIGRNKLYARIRELTGMTPNEFVLKLKLDESIELLNNHPELNISEISDRLGFSSTPYFTKCFKSIYGIAPLNYRKRD